MGFGYLRIGENLWGNDFVGTERLSGVDEGSKDFGCFLDLAWNGVSTAAALPT